jgi:two-component system sensor kinase FixL
LTILLFAAAFFLVQRLTIALRSPLFKTTTIWTPGALLFAALLLAPLRRWWVYYAGLCLGVLAAFYDDTEISVATALLAAHFLFGAVALGAWGNRRFGSCPPFGSLTSLLGFVPIALVLVPLLTTAPVNLARFVKGVDDVWPVALRSLLSIALGMLIATPALTLSLAHGRFWLCAGSWWRYLESASLVVGLATVVLVCFGGPTGTTATPALLYAPLPLLLWAAMRFGLAGVSWALLLAFQSTWDTVHGRGPFTNQSPSENIVQLQLFLLAISLPLMFLAALVQERRRAFAALSQSEERFRLVVESTPNAIVIVNEAGKIVLLNTQGEKFFGYHREELVGQPVEILVPERFRPAHPGYRAGFFAFPSVRPMGAGRDLYDRRKDGSEFPIEIGLTPIETGAGLFVLCAILDISGRKQVEEARQELAHATRLALIGELTASIAHEINQPLGAILSNADAAEMLLDSSPVLLDDVRHILDDIRKDDLRASEVIRRLCGLLRKRELEMQPLDLNELAAEVLLLVRAETRRRGVSVETELAADFPLVRGDRVHLQQILLNLLLNGMEAMAHLPTEKRLTVRTALNPNGWVEMTVSDAGVGIPPERLPHLFDPFFSTKKEGMGLGLSIARSLVEAHGGRICAENNPGGGATFRFTLPIGVQKSGTESSDTQGASLELTA